MPQENCQRKDSETEADELSSENGAWGVSLRHGRIVCRQNLWQFFCLFVKGCLECFVCLRLGGVSWDEGLYRREFF